MKFLLLIAVWGVQASYVYKPSIFAGNNNRTSNCELDLILCINAPACEGENCHEDGDFSQSVQEGKDILDKIDDVSHHVGRLKIFKYMLKTATSSLHGQDGINDVKEQLLKATEEPGRHSAFYTKCLERARKFKRVTKKESILVFLSKNDSDITTIESNTSIISIVGLHDIKSRRIDACHESIYTTSDTDDSAMKLAIKIKKICEFNNPSAAIPTPSVTDTNEIDSVESDEIENLPEGSDEINPDGTEIPNEPVPTTSVTDTNEIGPVESDEIESPPEDSDEINSDETEIPNEPVANSSTDIDPTDPFGAETKNETTDAPVTNSSTDIDTADPFGAETENKTTEENDCDVHGCIMNNTASCDQIGCICKKEFIGDRCEYQGFNMTDYTLNESNIETETKIASDNAKKTMPWWAWLIIVLAIVALCSCVGFFVARRKDTGTVWFDDENLTTEFMGNDDDLDLQVLMLRDSGGDGAEEETATRSEEEEPIAL